MNWCKTLYVFHGSTEELTLLKDKICSSIENAPISDVIYGKGWLGNILVGVGITSALTSSGVAIPCSGRVTHKPHGEVKDVISLKTETIGMPLAQVWCEVIKVLRLTTVGFSYRADYVEGSLFEIYDTYGDFKEDYKVDVVLEGKDRYNRDLIELRDGYAYTTAHSLYKYLQNVFESGDDLLPLIIGAERYPFEDKDSSIHVYEYTRVSEPL